MFVPKWLFVLLCFALLLSSATLMIRLPAAAVASWPTPDLPAACKPGDGSALLCRTASGQVWLWEPASISGERRSKWRKLQPDEFTKNFGVFRPQ